MNQMPLRLLRPSLALFGRANRVATPSLHSRFSHVAYYSTMPEFPDLKPPPPPPNQKEIPIPPPSTIDTYVTESGEFLVDDTPIVPQVFEEKDFGRFEPMIIPLPEAKEQKRKRKTKEEREREKLEAAQKPEDPSHVPAHITDPQERFRYRILMARVEGEEEMKRIEQEIEDNLQQGENRRNRAAIESGLMQTQWKLRPLGFHSKWLWGLARKYCGDAFAVEYLLKSRTNLHNWYIFCPTRQLCLWRDILDDLITSATPSLDAKKVTISQLLDCIGVYHVDTDERNQYTYLEDQITGYKPPHVSEKVKLLMDNIPDKYIFELFAKMVIDFQPMMKLMTEEHMLDLVRAAIPRMSEGEFKKLSEIMDYDNATEIRHMPEVRKLFGLNPKPKTLPPPFVPPPEPPKPPVPSEF